MHRGTNLVRDEPCPARCGSLVLKSWGQTLRATIVSLYLKYRARTDLVALMKNEENWTCGILAIKFKRIQLFQMIWPCIRRIS
jgi:hypothetical protein